MEVFHYLIFLKLVAHIAAVKSKSVNLALETVLEFNSKDKGADVKLLDNVQQFIDKIKTFMATNRPARRFDTKSRSIKFTEFVKSAIDTLKTYDDDDLEDLFAVLDDEIRKYHYRGCKFYELVEDQKVRRFVANKLDDIKDKPASKLRKSLNDAINVIENSKFSRKQAEFLDYVNSIYGQKSSNKLKTFLNKLQTYSSKSKRANLNLVKVVRDGLKSVIFDHYTALNPNARRDLKIKLETSWRSVEFPDRVEHRVWTVRYKNNNDDTNKYNQYNPRTDFENKVTTSSVKLKTYDTEGSSSPEMSEDEEKIQTTPHHIEKPRNNKLIDLKNVYFNSENDDKTYDIEKELNTHPIELKWSNSEESFSSEALDIEDKITHHYPKQRTKKYKDSQSNSKENYVSPQKLSHPKKKTYTFLTLYPEEITFDAQKKKQLKIQSTTRKSRIYTLWEEKITRNDEKAFKLRASKSHVNFRTNVEKPRVIAESDTVIDVRRPVLTSAEDGSNQRSSLESNSERKPTKRRSWHQTKTTRIKYRPTPYEKFQKHIPKATTPEENISIESYAINRRSMNNKNINDTSAQPELKRNVMKRINNLEKEMEEVKSKIETTKSITDKMKVTVFEPLDYWNVRTVLNTARDTTSSTPASITISSTKPSTKSSTKLTTDKMKVTVFEPLDYWNVRTVLNTAPDTTSSTRASITISSTKPSTKSSTKSSTQSRTESSTKPSTKSSTKLSTKPSTKSSTQTSTQFSTKSTDFEESVTQLETENNVIMQSIYNETINTENDNQIDTNFDKDTEEMIKIDIQEDKTSDDVNQHQNISVPEKKNIITNLRRNVDNVIGNDKDIDGLMQKYNISPKPKKIKAFDLDTFLEESQVAGLDPDKVSEVKKQMENDMKRLMKEKPKDPKEMSDPFQDINIALDLMRH